MCFTCALVTCIMGNLNKKSDKQILEGKIPSYVKKMSKETKVNIDKDNEIQSLQAEVPKRHAQFKAHTYVRVAFYFVFFQTRQIKK